jgi:hypothetical protein
VGRELLALVRLLEGQEADLERLAVEEVEVRETVFDPIGAAPNRPFGHPHTAWRAFVDGRAERDELWSFSADWRTVCVFLLPFESQRGDGLLLHGGSAAYDIGAPRITRGFQ